MTTIAKQMDGILRPGWIPALKADGYRKTRWVWKRVQEQGTAVVDVQRSRWNREHDVQFTINLEFQWSHEEGSSPSVQRRVGFILPGGSDCWWRVTPVTNREALSAELVEVYHQFIVPWIDAVSVGGPAVAEAWTAPPGPACFPRPQPEPPKPVVPAPQGGLEAWKAEVVKSRSESSLDATFTILDLESALLDGEPPADAEPLVALCQWMYETMAGDPGRETSLVKGLERYAASDDVQRWRAQWKKRVGLA